MKVCFLVTHLLGSGHLARTAALAKAFRAAGWQTLLISGGRPAPHLTDGAGAVEQLPPLASDGVNFRRLLDEHGDEASAALHERRREKMVDALGRFRPDVFVTELFPFGRRQLAGEFETALRAASALKPRPVIFASVRDILQPPSKPERVAEAETRLTRFYDGVLVHGDPSIMPLSASYPTTPAMDAMLRYTGFVAGDGAAAAHEDSSDADGAGEVLVAAGGGAVGDALFEAACGAAALMPTQRWRLLVGGSGAARDARIERFRALASDGDVIVEAVRPDYRALLVRCAVSVSQIGYNTGVDLLQAGVPAVLAPFEEGGESEQRMRADAFAARFGMSVLAPGAGPQAVFDAVSEALARGAGLADARGEIDLNGARNSVMIAEEAVASRRKRETDHGADGA